MHSSMDGNARLSVHRSVNHFGLHRNISISISLMNRLETYCADIHGPPQMMNPMMLGIPGLFL